MFAFLPRVFNKLFPHVAKCETRRREARYVRPRLEALEDRVVPAVDTFAAPGGSGQWTNAASWSLGRLPGEADTAVIPAGESCVLSSATTQSIQSLSVSGTLTLGSPSPSGETGTIDAVMATLSGGTFNIGDPGSGSGGDVTVTGTMTQMGGTLNVGGAGGSSGSLDVNTLSASSALNVYTSGKIDDKSSAAIGGATTVLGQIEAENIDDLNGAGVVFSGPVTIGPGTLDGNLKAGINASFTFSPFSTGTLVAGATLGDGQYIVNGPLTIDGTLSDTVADITLNSGSTAAGSISGSGSIDDWATFEWNGGIIGLAGGMTLEPTADFKTAGAGTKTLAAGTITNICPYTELGGTGSLLLDTGATFDNASGNVDVTLPSIASGSPSGGGLFTNTGGSGSTLDFQAPSTSPTVITCNFINNGNLDVAGSDAATVDGPPFVGGTYELDGTLGLEGDLTLEGAIASPTGVTVNGGGNLLIGNSGGLSGKLTLASGSTTVIGGNVEVTGDGTLTGGGQVDDNGKLTLDVGSAATIGSYQQSSTGTLDIQATSGPGGPTYSALTVSGSA